MQLRLASLGLIFTVFMGVSSANAIETVTGQVKKQGGTEVLFNYKRTEEKLGAQKILTNTYYNLDGSIAVQDTAYLDESGKLLRYEHEQKQVGAKGYAKFEGGEVKIHYEHAGDTTNESEDLEGEVVIGPILSAKVLENMDSMIKGKDFHFRYVVLARGETIGFRFKFLGKTKLSGKEHLSFQMEPSSWVIRALVDPLKFYYDAETRRLRKVTGRTVPKIKVDGKFKDLDADTYYSFADGK
jgi:hypothetical protein